MTPTFNPRRAKVMTHNLLTQKVTFRGQPVQKIDRKRKQMDGQKYGRTLVIALSYSKKYPWTVSLHALSKLKNNELNTMTLTIK